MAEAGRIGDPNDPNAGLINAAYESAKKDIPTAYGKAEIIENRAKPGTELIDKVPGITQPEVISDSEITKQKFDAELTRMGEGFKNLSEYAVPHADLNHLEHVQKMLADYSQSIDKIIEAKQKGEY